MILQACDPDVEVELSVKAYQVALQLTEMADGKRLPMVWLRPGRLALETLFQDDLDFLYDPDRLFAILKTLFDLCRDQGLSVRLVQPATSFKITMEVLAPPGRVLQLEMWPHAECRKDQGHGRLSRCAIPYAEFQRLGELQKPSALAAMFLLHLHHKDKDLLSPSVQERLGYFCDLANMSHDLQSCMKSMLAGHVTIENGRACAHDWIQSAGLKVTSPIAYQVEKLRRYFSGIRIPAIRTIAVVGPDGSGKTTLIENARQNLGPSTFSFVRFKRYFRRVLVRVFRAEPRNIRDEKMLWLVLPVAWLHFLLVRTVLGWFKPAIMDRYFYDYLAKDVRSATRPLHKITGYSFSSSIVPRPTKLVVASCATSVILSRKAEMQPHSIDALYDLYLDQICRSSVHQVLFCDTRQSAERSAHQMSAFVLDRS